jgi:hypothetical protein
MAIFDCPLYTTIQSHIKGEYLLKLNSSHQLIDLPGNGFDLTPEEF